MTYLWIKWLHILSSTLLFGTGLGSAFYMFFASRTRDPRVVATVVKHVVIADWVFTTPAIIAQPATGFYLVHLAGYPLKTPWILWSVVLYLVAGAAWLPVVWMQMRMRVLAERAAAEGQPLPPAYHKLFWTWFAFGFPAFATVAGILWLMIARPGIGS
jgi:uncharacterized membrane protein